MKKIMSVVLFLMLIAGGAVAAEEKITFDDGSVYQGQVKDGKCNGKGTLTYADGSKYVGTFAAGVFEGPGVLTDKSGLVSEGNFSKGKLNGMGVLKFSSGNKYIGEFKDGVRSGKGRMLWTDGNMFDGEWKNDKINGKGIIRRHELHVYIGEFKDGNYDGQGMKIYENGDVFEGIHRGHWPVSGTYLFANGDKYEGEFQANHMEGKGVMVFSNGAKYEGDFHNGALTGHGVMTYMDGSKSEGEFVNGEPQGKGEYTTPEGKKMSVTFKDGKMMADAAPAVSAAPEPIFLRPEGLKKNQKTALIVFLHGSKSSPEECEPVFAPLVESWRCSVLYPRGSVKTGVFPTGKGAYDWDAAKDVDAIIAAIKKVEGVDSKRIFLTGFSSGAAMAYRVALKAPGMFAGVIPFSGAVPSEYLAAQNPAPLASKVPFYIVNGEDDTIVSPQSARAAETYLKKLGAPVKVNIFQGTHYLPENHFDMLKEAIEFFEQSSKP